jgi:bifunctional non-homologous end joining protein LigD
MGDGWLHEIKHDGYRMQVRKDGNRVRLFTRRGFDWTERYGWVVESVAKLSAKTLTIDGELVVAGADGVADFARLHSRCADNEAFLYGFDLLEVDGEDLRPQPLLDRKAALAKVLRRAPAGVLVEHADGMGQQLFEAACEMGLEGIVSKKADRPYRSGPKKCLSWVKVKNKRAPPYMRFHDGLDG